MSCLPQLPSDALISLPDYLLSLRLRQWLNICEMIHQTEKTKKLLLCFFPFLFWFKNISSSTIHLQVHRLIFVCVCVCGGRWYILSSLRYFLNSPSTPWPTHTKRHTLYPTLLHCDWYEGHSGDKVLSRGLNVEVESDKKYPTNRHAEVRLPSQETVRTRRRRFIYVELEIRSWMVDEEVECPR